MAWRGLALSEEVEWIHPNDDPKDPTRWFLKPLTSRMQATLRDDNLSMNSDPDSPNRMRTNLNVNRRNLRTVRFGLSRWERFLDHKGAPIPVKKEEESLGGAIVEVVATSVLDQMDFDLITTLATQIQELSEPSQEMRRKSTTSGDGGEALPRAEVRELHPEA